MSVKISGGRTGMLDYKQHPLSMMFPPMAKDGFRRLCYDIAANGLQFAITLFAGMILDGWHRYLACKQLGTEPVFKEFEGDLAAARKYVISANHHRRHAKPAQIAMIAAEVATLPHGGHRGTAEEQNVALEPVTVAEASKVFGVNTSYIKMARQVLGSGDGDLIAEVKNCRKQLADAAREVQSRRSKQERVKKVRRSDKPPSASEPGENALEPGDGLNGGGAEDKGITGEPVDAAAAPEGAAEKSTAIEEPADNPIKHADVRGQGGRAGNDTGGLAGRRAASAAVRAEPPQTSAPENDTVELECASNQAAEEPVSAPRPAKGAGDEPEPTPKPVKNTIEAASSLSVASGDGNDPAIDEPVNPHLLVRQAGEELGTIVESGAGSNHPEPSDADHPTGDPGGAPSSEVKIQRVTIQKKKRKIQHPELFPRNRCLPRRKPSSSTRGGFFRAKQRIKNPSRRTT
jgi:hypothetical protein